MNKIDNYAITDLPSPKRLESLTDGVFAVTMALLALGLTIIEAYRSPGIENLALWFSQRWLKFIIYGISFLVLGVFWVLHQKQFRYILGYDGILLWINIIFLMFVALVPFSTFFLYAHNDEWIAMVFYGTHQIVICQLLFLNWCYASHKRRLIGTDTSARQCRIPMILFQFISFGFLAAIIVASFSPILFIIILALTLVTTMALLASRHRNIYADQREIKE